MENKGEGVKLKHVEMYNMIMPRHVMLLYHSIHMQYTVPMEYSGLEYIIVLGHKNVGASLVTDLSKMADVHGSFVLPIACA